MKRKVKTFLIETKVAIKWIADQHSKYLNDYKLNQL